MSKEEIEKAKHNLGAYIDLVLNRNYCECNELNEISCGKYCDGSKNVAESMKTLLQYIEQLESRVQAQEMEHKYDVNMIDEVKGEAVQLYNKIEKLNKMIDEMAIYIGLILKEDNDTMFCNDKNICDGNCDKCIKQYFEEKVEEK